MAKMRRMAASEGTDRAPAATESRWRWATRWRHVGADARYAGGMVAALAYYYLVPDPLLALPGLAAFAALAWLRLELALCLLPLTFPFWYVPKRALGHTVFPLSEITLGVCLAAAIGQLALAWLQGAGNAKDAKQREGREEGEGGTAEDAEGSELAPEPEYLPGSIVLPRGIAMPAESDLSLFAHFASLRALRVLRLIFRREWRWLVIGAVLLLVGSATGVLIAVRPRDALRAFRWEVVEPLLYLALVIACLWARNPRTAAAPGSDERGGRASERLIGWLAGPVIAVGALFGVLAIAQVLWLHVTFTPLAAGNHLVAGGSLLRANGIYYGSANSLGALLERVLPLALALLLWRVLGGTENAENAENAKMREGREGAEERATAVVPSSPSALPSASSASSAVPPSLPSPSSVPSVVNLSLLLAGCVLVMAAGLALSASRGAEVGAAAGLLLVLLAHPRTRRIAVGIMLLGAVIALWQAGALLQAALVGHGASGEVRLLVWQSALHMIRDHPLLGIGPDQFLYYYDPAYTAHPYWIPRIGGHLTPAVYQPDLAQPHNLILDLWLSGGVLGLLGFALVAGWLARSCWRIWRANQRQAARRWTAQTALVVGAGGGVFAGLTHGMVDSAYFQPDLALLFWWAVAVVAVMALPRLSQARNAAPWSPLA